MARIRKGTRTITIMAVVMKNASARKRMPRNMRRVFDGNNMEIGRSSLSNSRRPIITCSLRSIRASMGALSRTARDAIRIDARRADGRSRCTSLNCAPRNATVRLTTTDFRSNPSAPRAGRVSFRVLRKRPARLPNGRRALSLGGFWLGPLGVARYPGASSYRNPRSWLTLI
jgi:hypothetical protein